MLLQRVGCTLLMKVQVRLWGEEAQSPGLARPGPATDELCVPGKCVSHSEPPFPGPQYGPMAGVVFTVVLRIE